MTGRRPASAHGDTPEKKAAAARKTAKKAAKKAAKPAKKTAKKAAPAKKAAKETAPAKKAAKKTAKKAAPAKKAAKKTAKKAAPAKKAAKKAAPAKKVAKKTAKKAAPAKKAAKKTAKKAAPAKRAAKKAAPGQQTAPVRKAAPAKKASPAAGGRTDGQIARSLAVLDRESPWTAKEVREVRTGLESEQARLRGEIDRAESDLQDLLREGVDGAGNDQADVGSNSLERDAEMSLAQSHRELLRQVEHALERIQDGSYGSCESCGNPIGKMRLMAFPRATLCMSCKQREERR